MLFRSTKGKKMPFYSSVPAGYPFPAIDINKKEIDINHFLVPQPASTFLLRVKDDSMVHAGIVQGDFIIVDRGVLTGKEGDILVIADAEEKSAQFHFHTIEESSSYDQTLVLGKLVGVFRRLN